jgi:hypothetical protein
VLLANGRDRLWGARASRVLAKAFRLHELSLEGRNLRILTSPTRSSFRRNVETARYKRALPKDCSGCLLWAYWRRHGSVTFWVRGLQTSLTNTKAKVFASGRLNLYTPGPLQFLGIAPARRVSCTVMVSPEIV